ncbi:MAG: HEAT repeat domain-containing protein [Rubripirellula sp.]
MFWISTLPTKQTASWFESPVVITAMACLLCVGVSGCQDGPLYALKVANPYYSQGEWKRDAAIGVTDHERLNQLTMLADTIGGMSTSKQQTWSVHLEKLIENDESPEMRRLAVRAAGKMRIDAASNLIEKGLDDDSFKVRMEACETLGRRKGDESIRSLAAIAGTETNEDVRHAALAALGKHRGPLATDSLKVALSDRNPATRDLAIQSLRGSTGKDYGNDPKVWIAALDGKPTRQVETRFADRIRDIF